MTNRNTHGAQDIRQAFDRARSEGRAALITFLTLGYPSLEESQQLVPAMQAGGADIIELGIPFSDPVADGPAIQQADARALAAGATPPVALDVVARFRRRHPDVPVGLLLYANLVHAPGPARFYARATAAGVDSVLIADVPLEESRPFRRAAAVAGVGTVSLVAPTSTDQRLAAVVQAGGPYLYVVSRVGVTGQDRELAGSAASLLSRLRKLGRIPTLLGFGISRPEHVRAALAAGASGAISGSAVVSIINRNLGDRAALLAEVRAFVREMKEATLPRD